MHGAPYNANLNAGTAGLVLAARLIEDPNVSVAILEAGKDMMHSPKINIPAAAIQAFGDPDMDWDWRTVPQV